MKKISESNTNIIYQCEKCGNIQYVIKGISKQPVKCCCIDCQDYGYNNDHYTSEQHESLYELRKKNIGKVFTSNSQYIILDFLSLDTVVICNLAGFHLSVVDLDFIMQSKQ